MFESLKDISVIRECRDVPSLVDLHISPLLVMCSSQEDVPSSILGNHTEKLDEVQAFAGQYWNTKAVAGKYWNTEAVAGKYWNTSGLLPILLILVNLEAKGPRVLFFLLFPRCRLTNHGNQVSATALIFTSPPTFSSGEEAEQRSAFTTLPTHCPAVFFITTWNTTYFETEHNATSHYK